MSKFNLLTADLLVDANDWEGVHLAIKALQKDIELVGGTNEKVKEYAIIIGTLGKSSILDDLVESAKVDLSCLKGKRESFVLEEIQNGTSRALVVAGSDKRGTIYGVYKLSEMIGVSPWVWWADSVPARRESVVVEQGFRFESREPSVKYRGFFCNDEAPSLTGWVGKHFAPLKKLENPKASPGYNSFFYAKVFELILRLKGNYYWPVMWNNSFHTDDPLNSELANKMGIVMGTSHHEHMTCADKEWTWSGRGDWNYHTNKNEIYDFWHEGVNKRRRYESIITLGMRGQADTSILGADATLRDNMALLQGVINDQREIIKDVHTTADAVPQMIALYKEVEDFYYGDGTGEAGGKLEVPDDVTLMLCDDNFGNIRTLPTEEMLKRRGGFGMYYHFDYRGGPVSYEWINQTPLAKCWDNMTAAYDAGVRDIWIVNVGDLKPMELPLSYFMELAYDFEKWSAPNKTEEFTLAWARREFGEEFAADTALVLNKYTRILGARKAEVVLTDTFSLTNFNEADRILADFKEVVTLAEKIYAKLPTQKKDSFFQLALYPTRAAFNTYATHIYAAKGLEKEAKEAFDKCTADMEIYNTGISDGKWDGIMRQNHMGYTAWDGPKISVVPNEMPEIKNVVLGEPFPTPENSVSINPSSFTKNVAANGAEFVVIKNYGRDADSVKILPNSAAFAPNAPAPMLEYSFSMTSNEDMAVSVFLQPTNPPRNFIHVPKEEQMRFSIQINGGERITIHSLPDGDFTPGHGQNWEFGVMNNNRIAQIPCGKLPHGENTLHIFAVDPAVIIQKIVIAPAVHKPQKISWQPITEHFMDSYLGPPCN